MNREALRAAIAPEWLPWLLAATLLVLGAALAEAVVLGRRGRYDWRAFAATLGDLAGRRLVDALGLSMAAPVLAWAYAHRLTTLALDQAGTVLLLFVGQEFCYYWHHRASHRVRWWWASHCVHHSPNQLTLASALRLGWTGRLGGAAVFFAPLVWIGFAPGAVLAAVALNLLYQFWLHATWIPQAGPARVGAQHAIAPPRAPRAQPGLPRPQLRRRADRVRPPVRYLRRRTRRRTRRSTAWSRRCIPTTRCASRCTAGSRCCATCVPRADCGRAFPRSSARRTELRPPPFHLTQDLAMNTRLLPHALAAASAAALLAACGGGGSDATDTTLSQETAESATANTLAIPDSAAAAGTESLKTAQAVVAGGQASQTYACAGGGTATFTISGATVAGATNGQLDAGETYSLQFAACRGSAGAASVDGAMTLVVTAASAGALTVQTTTQGLTVALPQRTLTWNGSSTLAQTVVTNGATTTTTTRWTSPQIELTSQRNARNGTFTLSNVDVTRSVAVTGGVVSGSEWQHGADLHRDAAERHVVRERRDARQRQLRRRRAADRRQLGDHAAAQRHRRDGQPGQRRRHRRPRAGRHDRPHLDLHDERARRRSGLIAAGCRRQRTGSTPDCTIGET